MMLAVDGIGLVDNPWSQFAHPMLPKYARAVAHAVENGLSDRVAWELVIGEEHRLEIYRAIYGNRKGPIKRRPTPLAGHRLPADFEPTRLWDFEEAS